MLPTLVDEAPDGEAWVHEIKYDGYRTQLVLAEQNSRAYTRNGYDWTDKYGIVVAAAKALKCRSAVIDGEMCVQNAAGLTDFKALRSAIKRSPERLMLFAFDILSLDGQDLSYDRTPCLRTKLWILEGASRAARITSNDGAVDRASSTEEERLNHVAITHMGAQHEDLEVSDRRNGSLPAAKLRRRSRKRCDCQ